MPQQDQLSVGGYSPITIPRDSSNRVTDIKAERLRSERAEGEAAARKKRQEALKKHLSEYDDDPVTQTLAAAEFEQQERDAAEAQQKLFEENLVSEYDDPVAKAVILGTHRLKQAEQPVARQAQADRDAIEKMDERDRMARKLDRITPDNAFVRESVGGVLNAAPDFIGLAARLTGNHDAANEMYHQSQDFGQAREGLRQDDMSPWLSRMYGGAVQSVTQMAGTPGGAMGKIAGSGVMAGSQALTTGEDAGLKGGALYRYAGTQGILEAGVAALSQKFLGPGMESRLAGEAVAAQTWKQLAKNIGTDALKEMPEEALTSILQDVSSKLEGVEPGLAFGDFVERATEAAVQAAMMSGITGSKSAAGLAGRKLFGQNEQIGEAPPVQEATTETPPADTASPTAEIPDIGGQIVRQVMDDFVANPSRKNFKKLPPQVRPEGVTTQEQRQELAEQMQQAKEAAMPEPVPVEDPAMPPKLAPMPPAIDEQAMRDRLRQQLFTKEPTNETQPETIQVQPETQGQTEQPPEAQGQPEGVLTPEQIIPPVATGGPSPDQSPETAGPVSTPEEAPVEPVPDDLRKELAKDKDLKKAATELGVQLSGDREADLRAIAENQRVFATIPDIIREVTTGVSPQTVFENGDKYVEEIAARLKTSQFPIPPQRISEAIEVLLSDPAETPEPPAKPPVPTFAALPQKSQDLFNKAFESKDTTALKQMVGKNNVAWNKEFENRTGIKLPKTLRDRHKVVLDWAAPATVATEPEKPADTGRLIVKDIATGKETVIPEKAEKLPDLPSVEYPESGPVTEDWYGSKSDRVLEWTKTVTPGKLKRKDYAAVYRDGKRIAAGLVELASGNMIDILSDGKIQRFFQGDKGNKFAVGIPRQRDRAKPAEPVVPTSQPAAEPLSQEDQMEQILREELLGEKPAKTPKERKPTGDKTITPKPRKPRTEAAKKRTKDTAEELKAAAEEFRKQFGKPTTRGGFVPVLTKEQMRASARLVKAALNHNISKFNEFVAYVVDEFGRDVALQAAEGIELAWRTLKRLPEYSGIDDAGKVADVLGPEKGTADENNANETGTTDAEGSAGDQAAGTGDRGDGQDTTGATDAAVLEGETPPDDDQVGGAGDTAGLRGSPGGKIRSRTGKAGSKRGSKSKRGSTDSGGTAADDAGDGRGTGNDRAPQATRPNYHLTTPDAIIGGGLKAKFARNRKAIEIVRDLDGSGRSPTAEELDTLAGYMGWGAFGQEIFNGSWENPRPKEGWENEDEWLRAYLGEEDWKSANLSIANAHYTDPQTVTAMWDMLRRMGFTGGRVLEPSMGVGNFFSLMPRDLMERSSLTGIELDTMTAKIAKLLHPQANIQQKGYQESQTPDNFYDVIVSNVPFGKIAIPDRRYKQDFSIHNYFFKRAFDQVKPGGVIAFLTSNMTMDGKTQAKLMRAQIATAGDLITAIRLPSGAFQAYAGTKVVADLIVIRKRKEGEQPQGDQNWYEVVDVETPNGHTIATNEYWQTHPQNILGTMTWGHGTTSGRPGMIVVPPSDLQTVLDTAIQSVPENIINTERAPAQGRERANTTAKRQNSVLAEDNDLWIVKGEQLVPLVDVVAWYRKGSKQATIDKNRKELESLLDVREAMRNVLDKQANSENAEEARAELNRAYDSFVATHGPIGKSAAAKHLRKAGDPMGNTLLALEHVSGLVFKKYTKRQIFHKSTVRQRRSVDSPTLNDAFAIERNRSLDLDMDRIAALAKMPVEEAIAKLETDGKIYNTGRGTYDASDVFLSGNMARKLRQLQAAQEEGVEGLERSIAAIKERIPTPVPYSQIEAKLGATWIEATDYADMIGHLLNEPASAITVERRITGWKVTIPANINQKTEATHTHGHPGIAFSKLMTAAMNNATVKLTMPDPENPDSRVTDPVATSEANSKINELRETFSSWLWASPERITRLSGAYNEEFNSTVTPEFDDVPLQFEGLTLERGDQPFNLRKHQEAAVWRGIVTGKGIFAHEVGTGKSLTIGAMAMEARRLGIASKPILLAHNANSLAVRNEIQEAYPSANILYVDNLDAANKAATLQAIATENWDLIVVPHSMAENFQLRPETVRALLKPEMDALEAAALEAFEESDASDYAKGNMPTDLDTMNAEDLRNLKEPTAKELVRERLKLRAQIDKAVQAMDKGTGIFFEDMGVDMVMVDEAHLFKKLPITTKQQIKGLNKTASQMGTMLMMLTDYIRSNNKGRGVYLFTGTPITNTINEIFNMMRFVMAEEMDAANVRGWDGWFNNFATQETLTELSSGGTWENFDRLSSFVNLPELRQMVGQFMDIVFADDMPEFKPRDSRDGRSENPIGRPFKQVHNVIIDMVDAQREHSAALAQRYTEFKNASGRDKVRMMREPGGLHSPLVIEGEGVKLAMDPRLTGFGTKMVDGKLVTDTSRLDPKNTNLKINKMLQNALTHYHEHPKSAQMVFMQVGYTDTVQRTVGRTRSGDPIKQTFPVFNLAKEIKRRLIEEGVPESEIAIFSGMSKEKRTEAASLMKQGIIRFAIGSTETMGTGINAQDELIAMHHLDAPWMPGDLEQRNGRGHRQGNKWNTVHEYRYLTEGPQDGRRWQVLLTKSKFIQEFMRGDASARVIEMDDVDMSEDGTGTDMQQTFAAAAGDPRIMQRIRLEGQVARLERMRDSHARTITETASKANSKLRTIQRSRETIDTLTAMHATWSANRTETPEITIRGKKYTGNQEINDELSALGERYRNSIHPRIKLGEYRGLPLFVDNGTIYVGEGRAESETWASREAGGRSNDMLVTANWSLASLQGIMSNLPERAAKLEQLVEREQRFIDMAHKAVGEQFPKQAQLDSKHAQLGRLNAEMNRNPTAAPAWLRAGAPIGTDVYWKGTKHEVAGHRMDHTVPFVLHADGDQFTPMPATELTDAEGTPLFPAVLTTPDSETTTPETETTDGSEETNDEAEITGSDTGGHQADDQTTGTAGETDQETTGQRSIEDRVAALPPEVSEKLADVFDELAMLKDTEDEQREKDRITKRLTAYLDEYEAGLPPEEAPSVAAKRDAKFQDAEATAAEIPTGTPATPKLLRELISDTDNWTEIAETVGTDAANDLFVKLTDPESLAARPSLLQYDPAKPFVPWAVRVAQNLQADADKKARKALGEQIVDESGEVIESEAAKAARLARAAVDEQKAKNAEALKKISREYRRFGSGETPPTGVPLTAEMVDAIVEYAIGTVKLGYRSFDAFIKEMRANLVDDGMMIALKPTLIRSWNAIREEFGLGEATDATFEAGMTAPVTEEPVAEESDSKAPPAPIGDGRTYSTKHAFSDAARAAGGFGERPAVVPQPREPSIELAAHIAKTDPARIDSLILELTSHPRVVTPLENDMLNARNAQLGEREESALRKQIQGAKDKDAVAEALGATEATAARMERQALREVILEPSGTAAGRALQARKAEIAEDFTMVRSALLFEAAHKRPPNTKELAAMQADIDALQAKVAELDALLAKEQANTKDLEAKLKAVHDAAVAAISKPAKTPKTPTMSTDKTAAEKAKAQIDNGFKKLGAIRGKTYSIETATADIAEALVEIAAGYSRLGVITLREFLNRVAKRMGPDAKAMTAELTAAWKQVRGATELPDISSVTNKIDPMVPDTIGKAARALHSYVIERDGLDATAAGRVAAVNAVHEILVDFVPELTREETARAMSGIGIYSTLSDDEISVIRRDQKAQLLSLEQIRDWEAKTPPPPTGQERPPVSDEQRLLRRLVNAAKRASGIAESSEGQLKSALSAAKTAASNRIKDLTKALNDGERIAAKQSHLKPDAELVALRAQRDALQADYDAAFGKRQLTDEQRLAMAERALDRAILDLQTDLDSGKLYKDEAPKPRVTSPALEAKRAELEALKAHREELRVQSGEAEARSDAAYERHLKQRDAELARRLAEGDFMPKAKKPPRNLSKAALALELAIHNKQREIKRKREKWIFDNRHFIYRAIAKGPVAGAHILRKVLTAFDNSLIGRQGWVLDLIHPVISAKAARTAFPSNPLQAKSIFPTEQDLFNTEAALDADGEWIRLEKLGKLAVTGVHGGKNREEENQYVPEWVNKIWGMGGSERAASAFINTQRRLVFRNLVEKLATKHAKRGHAVSTADLKVIGNMVNVATGRADLGSWETALQGASLLFFSPRWWLSRLQWMSGAPIWLNNAQWAGGDGASMAVRALVAKEWGTQMAAQLAVIGLAYAGLMAAFGDPGEDEEWEFYHDARSPNFGKFRIRNTYIDMTAGMGSHLSFLSRMGTGTQVDRWDTTDTDRGRLLASYGRGKLAPVPSIAVDVMLQNSMNREKVGSLEWGVKHVAPLIGQDAYEAIKEEGLPAGSLIAAWAFFGGGERTQEARTRERRDVTNELRALRTTAETAPADRERRDTKRQLIVTAHLKEAAKAEAKQKLRTARPDEQEWLQSIIAGEESPALTAALEKERHDILLTASQRVSTDKRRSSEDLEFAGTADASRLAARALVREIAPTEAEAIKLFDAAYKATNKSLMEDGDIKPAVHAGRARIRALYR